MPILAPWLTLLLVAWPGPVLDPAADAGPWYEPTVATEAWLPATTAGRPAGPLTLDAGFRITAAGDLAGPRGRLAVWLGRPPQPVAARAKRWLDSRCPVLTQDTVRDGLQVQVQTLATALPGRGDVGLLRLTLRAGVTAEATTVMVGFVPDPGYLVPLPEPPPSSYALRDGWVERDGRLLYTFPQRPGVSRLATPDDLYDEPFAAPGAPTEPVALVRYAVSVPARQAVSLVFRLPAEPLPLTALPAVRQLDFDEAHLALGREWRERLAASPELNLPEAKADDAWHAAGVRLTAWGGVAAPDLTTLPASEGDRLLAAPTVRGLVVAPRSQPRLLLPLATLRRARWALTRGRAAEAAAGLYAVLASTSATHCLAGAVPADVTCRGRLEPWGVPGDAAPAAEYRALLLEALARADGRRLVLGSLVPPAWLAPGSTLAVHAAPTPFGQVEVQWAAAARGFTVTLPPGYERAPEAVRLVLPWWVTVELVLVDGRPVIPQGGTVDVPPTARQMQVMADLTRLPASPSFAAAAEAWRAAYRQAAEAWRAAGGSYTPWPWGSWYRGAGQVGFERPDEN